MQLGAMYRSRSRLFFVRERQLSDLEWLLSGVVRLRFRSLACEGGERRRRAGNARRVNSGPRKRKSEGVNATSDANRRRKGRFCQFNEEGSACRDRRAGNL